MKITGHKGTRDTEPVVRIEMHPDEAYELLNRMEGEMCEASDPMVADFRHDLGRARLVATAATESSHFGDES